MSRTIRKMPPIQGEWLRPIYKMQEKRNFKTTSWDRAEHKRDARSNRRQGKLLASRGIELVR